MTWEEQAIVVVAGIAGGAVLGIKGYAEVYGKESFNWRFFAKSLAVPVATGFGAALFATTPLEAFTFGMLGKSIQELYSSRKTTGSMPAVPVKTWVGKKW